MFSKSEQWHPFDIAKYARNWQPTGPLPAILHLITVNPKLIDKIVPLIFYQMAGISEASLSNSHALLQMEKVKISFLFFIRVHYVFF